MWDFFTMELRVFFVGECAKVIVVFKLWILGIFLFQSPVYLPCPSQAVLYFVSSKRLWIFNVNKVLGCSYFLATMCHQLLSSLVCHSAKVYYMNWNVLISSIFHGAGEGLRQQPTPHGAGWLGLAGCLGLTGCLGLAVWLAGAGMTLKGKFLGNILYCEEEN